MTRRLVADLVGTCFLVLIGPGAAINAVTGGGLGVAGMALAFAIVVIAMIYALGHLSGGARSRPLWQSTDLAIPR